MGIRQVIRQYQSRVKTAPRYGTFITQQRAKSANELRGRCSQQLANRHYISSFAREQFLYQGLNQIRLSTDGRHPRMQSRPLILNCGTSHRQQRCQISCRKLRTFVELVSNGWNLRRLGIDQFTDQPADLRHFLLTSNVGSYRESNANQYEKYHRAKGKAEP